MHLTLVGCAGIRHNSICCGCIAERSLNSNQRLSVKCIQRAAKQCHYSVVFREVARIDELLHNHFPLPTRMIRWIGHWRLVAEEWRSDELDSSSHTRMAIRIWFDDHERAPFGYWIS